MAKGLRAAVAAAALGMGLLGATGSARADTYDFTFTDPSFNNYSSYSIIGSFDLSGGVASNFRGTGTNSYGPTIYTLASGSNGTIDSSDYGYFIFQASNDTNTTYDYFSSQLIETGNTYSGVGNNRTFTATLENLLNPVPVGSGGGSTGGGSGGGTGASGSAPSPEVNTLLGLLLVGGTVAFMKRRRKGGAAEELSAA